MDSYSLPIRREDRREITIVRGLCFIFAILSFILAAIGFFLLSVILSKTPADIRLQIGACLPTTLTMIIEIACGVGFFKAGRAFQQFLQSSPLKKEHFLKGCKKLRNALWGVGLFILITFYVYVTP